MQTAFMVGPALLSPGREGGPLSGTRFATKDLFDVAGTRTSAGNPDWLASAPVAAAHCPAVSTLVGAGASLWGKTVTDELAFSLSGTNVHYGTPPNPRAPGRVPGGSSSGSASAVASGAVDFALGTDTGGSVRVPASYCGIFGLRPTHGRVSTEGVVALAPSFDTVGILAADGAVLGSATKALLAGTGAGIAGTDGTPSAGAPGHAQPRRIRRLVLARDLLALADANAATALVGAAKALAAALNFSIDEVDLGHPGDVLDWRDAFRTVQLYEVWQVHGRWVSEQRPNFGPGVAARFAAAATVGRDEAERARRARQDAILAFELALGDDALLVQPAATGPAPLPRTSPGEKDDLRARTLALTAPAGMAGAPVLALPLASANALPVGLALVGLPGDDEALALLAEAVQSLGLARTRASTAIPEGPTLPGRPGAP